MESDLALTKARLKEALERVELIHQAMTVDLPCIVEVSSLFLVLSLTPWPLNGCLACLLLVSQDPEMMSIHKSHFLREEHG